MNGLLGEEIKLDKNELTLAVAETQNLTAEVVAADSRKVSVFWKSLNPEIATVDENTGKVTGITEGTTAILAETSTGLMKECLVVVQNTESAQISFGQSD